VDPVPDPLFFSGSAENRTRASGSVAEDSDRIFINYLDNPINHSNRLPFADDLEVNRDINSPCDCLLPQSDIDFAHKGSFANFKEHDFCQIRFTALYQENENFKLAMQAWESFILRIDCSKDLVMHIDFKLHYHRQ
jgi:hypothetical protein